MIHYLCPGEDPIPDRPPLQCKLGHLIPTVPHCGVLGHDDWLAKLDISAGTHVVKNGDLDLEQAVLGTGGFLIFNHIKVIRIWCGLLSLIAYLGDCKLGD